ncbi:MAG TPA: hypothetical protein VL793_07355 [Patescibacteria group bacterium]|nr:hypothetical protein [Patescibacteria group bacterium]
MRKSTWIIGLFGVVGVAIGVMLFIGPGTSLHHALHRSAVLEPCGCHGSDASRCEWVAKPYVWESWAGHHRRLQRVGILLAAVSIALAGGYWGADRTLSWAARKSERLRLVWERAFGALLVILAVCLWFCFVLVGPGGGRLLVP